MRIQDGASSSARTKMPLLLLVVAAALSAASLSAANPPGTPAPDPRAAPPAVGASGNGRWQFSSATGLYIVDPAAGEIAIQGATAGSVPLVSVSLNKQAPPADTTITLNGVKLIRWAGNPQLQWTVDPAGPQPVVGSGGFIDLVASDGSGRQREMILPCPSDVDMISSPAIGTSLPGDSPVAITFADTVVLNPSNIPGMAGVFADASLVGYDTATGAVAGGALGHALIGAGQLGVSVPVVGSTRAPAYLMDVRWPGRWQVDGETGAFCGLAKRWTYRNDSVAAPAPVIVSVSPNSGSTAGGETVTIEGAALASVTGVSFDGEAASIVSRSDASITVTTPTHAPGAVSLLLSSPAGFATSTYLYVVPQESGRHRAARH